MKTVPTYMIFSSILMLLAFTSNAQPSSPKDLGLHESVIDSEELGEIHYYVTENKRDSLKPLLVYLDGSGSYPLFQTFEKGSLGSSVLLNFNELSADYHVVLISKPGVPFIEKMEFDEKRGRPIYDTPAEYHERLSLDWRVGAADAVIDDCLANLKVDSSKVAIIGLSEGYQVGASLLGKNKSITHSILMVGNGLNQFYDFVILNRMDVEKGKITPEEAQNNIDSLYQVFEDIYKYPTATDKFWYGHTYLRWASFCAVDPVDPIMASDIPVYMVICSDDTNTTAISADFVTLEAVRQNKKNIQTVVYPYNHSFRETVYNDDGEIVDKIDHMREVLDASLDWLKGME